MLDERETGLTQKEDQLKQQDASLQAKLTEADELVETRRQKLYDVAKLDKEQAKKIVLDQLSDELVKERAEMIRNSNEEVKAKADHFANQVIVDAIQSSAADTVAETTVSVVDLPNEEMKGRIIGHSGRKAVGHVHGCGLVKSCQVTVSRQHRLGAIEFETCFLLCCYIFS